MAGNFRLTDQDYTDLTNVMLPISPEQVESCLVCVMKGGYNLRGLIKAATARVETLIAGGNERC